MAILLLNWQLGRHCRGDPGEIELLMVDGCDETLFRSSVMLLELARNPLPVPFERPLVGGHFEAGNFRYWPTADGLACSTGSDSLET
jgi:hypothetical protein